MKFARYFQALERDAPEEWRGRFLRYKELKKGLKMCEELSRAKKGDDDGDSAREGARAGQGRKDRGVSGFAPPSRSPSPIARTLGAREPSEETLVFPPIYRGSPPGDGSSITQGDRLSFSSAEAAETWWFGELLRQLKAADEAFAEEAARVLGAHKTAARRAGLARCLPILDRGRQAREAALAQRAYWCRRFARANAVALRKILKKHDKLCRNERGRQFLAEAWSSRGAGAAASFLHSPLLDELKAMEEELACELEPVIVRADLPRARVAAGAGGDADHPDRNRYSGRGAKPVPRPPPSSAGPFAADPTPGGSSPTGHLRDSHGEHAPGDGSTTASSTGDLAGLEAGAAEAPGAGPAGRPSPSAPTAPPPAPQPGSAALSRLNPDPARGAEEGWAAPVPPLAGSDASLGPTPGAPTHAPIPIPASVRARPPRVAAKISPSLSRSLSQNTSSSYAAVRLHTLEAICESPTCLLDSSDAEWAAGIDGDEPADAREPPSAYAEADSLPAAAARRRGDPRRRAAGAPAAGPEAAEVGLASPPCLVPGGPAQRPAAAPAAAAPLAGTTRAADDLADPDAPFVVSESESSLAPPRTSSGGGGGVGSVSSAAGLGRLKSATLLADSDLTCPICLEVMYKPVGLRCGHKFCKRCVLSAAGYGEAIGTFRHVCSHIPARARCPSCRQRDVFGQAVSLRAVGARIASRYPQEWAERRKEEKTRDRSLQVMASLREAERYRSVRNISSPFELLL